MRYTTTVVSLILIMCDQVGAQTTPPTVKVGPIGGSPKIYMSPKTFDESKHDRTDSDFYPGSELRGDSNLVIIRHPKPAKLFTPGDVLDDPADNGKNGGKTIVPRLHFLPKGSAKAYKYFLPHRRKRHL